MLVFKPQVLLEAERNISLKVRIQGLPSVNLTMPPKKTTPQPLNMAIYFLPMESSLVLDFLFF